MHVGGCSSEVWSRRLIVEADEDVAAAAAIPHGDAEPYDLRLPFGSIWIEPVLEFDRETLPGVVDELLDLLRARGDS
jgi:hypothetical protein